MSSDYKNLPPVVSPVPLDPSYSTGNTSAPLQKKSADGLTEISVAILVKEPATSGSSLSESRVQSRSQPGSSSVTDAALPTLGIASPSTQNSALMNDLRKFSALYTSFRQNQSSDDYKPVLFLEVQHGEVRVDSSPRAVLLQAKTPIKREVFSNGTAAKTFDGVVTIADPVVVAKYLVSQNLTDTQKGMIHSFVKDLKDPNLKAMLTIGSKLTSTLGSSGEADPRSLQERIDDRNGLVSSLRDGSIVATPEWATMEPSRRQQLLEDAMVQTPLPGAKIVDCIGALPVNPKHRVLNRDGVDFTNVFEVRLKDGRKAVVQYSYDGMGNDMDIGYRDQWKQAMKGPDGFEKRVVRELQKLEPHEITESNVNWIFGMARHAIDSTSQCPGGGAFVLTMENQSFVMPHHDGGVLIFQPGRESSPIFVHDNGGVATQNLVLIETPPGTRIVTFTDGVSDAFTTTAETLLLQKLVGEKKAAKIMSPKFDSRKHSNIFEALYLKIFSGPQYEAQLKELIELRGIQKIKAIGANDRDHAINEINTNRATVQALEESIEQTRGQLKGLSTMKMMSKRKFQKALGEYEEQLVQAKGNEKLLMKDCTEQFQVSREIAQKVSALKLALLDIIDSPEGWGNKEEIASILKGGGVTFKEMESPEFQAIKKIAALTAFEIGVQKLLAGKKASIGDLIDLAIPLSSDDIGGTEYNVPMPEGAVAGPSSSSR